MNDSVSETGGTETGEARQSWWRRLRGGLARTSASIATAITDLVSKRKLDAGVLEELEDVLIRADLGVDHRIGSIKGLAVDGRIGVGLSILGQRPLPYGAASPAFALLDLRANPGGLLTEAVSVAGHMLPKGAEVVSQHGRASQEVSYKANEGNSHRGSATIIDFHSQ